MQLWPVVVNVPDFLSLEYRLWTVTTGSNVGTGIPNCDVSEVKGYFKKLYLKIL